MRIGVVVLVIRHHRVQHCARLLRCGGGVEVMKLRLIREERKIPSIDERFRHYAPSSMSAGPSLSVDTVFPSPCNAECSVCQARLAHFTRSGNFDTPPNARSEPRSLA